MLVNYKELYAKTARALESLHPIEPHKKVGDLSISNQQVVEIAKALTLDCRILILDEPTSALDAETEAVLMAALARLMRGRTTFIIAHRLSTVRRADRVVVLEQGRIVEAGTPQELLSRPGPFQRYHGLQDVSVGAEHTEREER